MMGEVLLLILALVSVPYNLVFHPRKSYRLVVHNVGWYD